MNNLVAIVGRPNVGKSSLFNKLVGKRKSIVHDEAGITRDRIYANVEWAGKKFKIIDTGGIEMSDKPFQDNIKIQAEIAIEEAGLIVFVVDGVEGLTSDDEFIISLLRKANKKIIVVANKLEGSKELDHSIWGTGFPKLFPISAIHGEGVGDLLDEVIKQLELPEKDETANENKKISIIGRPNAGKSSLLNAFDNSERAIVSPISGTTRDSISSNITINEREYTVIDTAGISRKSKLVESVDHYALARAFNSIDESDIVILVIDAERDMVHFDSVVAGYAWEKKKPIIFAINKWDIVQKETHSMTKKEQELRTNFKFLPWAPMEFISAKTGARLDKLKNLITEVDDNISKTIKTNVLNDVLNEIQIVQPAQTYNGGRLNIGFIKQAPDTKVPTFLMWVNNKKFLHFSYERFLENKFREYFGFKGVPIQLVFKQKKGVKGVKYD